MAVYRIKVDESLDPKRVDFMISLSKGWPMLGFDDSDEFITPSGVLGKSLILTVGTVLETTTNGMAASNPEEWFTAKNGYTYLFRDSDPDPFLASKDPNIAALVNAANVLIFGRVRDLSEVWSGAQCG